MVQKYIGVHISNISYHVDIEYSYSISKELFDTVRIGSIVIVPFGAADKPTTAVVTSLDVPAPRAQAKSVISVMNDYLSLDSDMLRLCFFMKEQFLCTIGEAVRCIVPSAFASKTVEKYTVSDKSSDGVPLECADVYFEIEKRPGITLDALRARLDGAQSRISWLLRNKYITRQVTLEEKDKLKYERVVSLAISKDEVLSYIDESSPRKIKSKKQAEILRLLCEFDTLSDKGIYEMSGATSAQLKALADKGYVKIEKIPVMRDPYASARHTATEDVVLNDEQQAALDSLRELYETGEPHGALLYGITGSGKTSVIKKMIDVVVSSGRGVIVLVPEISLTPQTVSVFCGYYGDRVAVIHSALSDGERFDAYRKIKDGEIDVVIGTRSAIFAPVRNLGMIVIDEEQEHTYKSDTNPKYLAHDIARFRCASSGALMLLASATPSINSYFKALNGQYKLVKLCHRYGKATLPDVIITDMKRERANGNTSVFSTKLASLTARTLDDKKQAILFLNRRGYHSAIACSECGRVIECPRCSVAMTYHSFKKIDGELDSENSYRIMSQSGLIRCHYCGNQSRIPRECPYCHSEALEYVGFGTQKLDTDLTELFPEARTLRLDADTTSTKSSYERILGSFLRGEADVMIGTQMVTKGHNFPTVTLVGVMLADMMLYTSDFRAAERTFSMLTQVIGRAGRAEDKGIAVIQTNSPNDRTILYAAEQDYESFYQNEIQIRKAYQFPPYCDLAVITIASPSETTLQDVSHSVLDSLQKMLQGTSLPAAAYGPFDAPVYKVQGRYRKRIILKCKLNKQQREILSRLLIEYTRGSSNRYTLSIDLNPSSL